MYILNLSSPFFILDSKEYQIHTCKMQTIISLKKEHYAASPISQSCSRETEILRKPAN